MESGGFVHRPAVEQIRQVVGAPRNPGFTKPGASSGCGRSGRKLPLRSRERRKRDWWRHRRTGDKEEGPRGRGLGADARNWAIDARSPPVPAQTVPGPMPPPEKNRNQIAIATTAATTTATATASRAVTGRVLLRSRGSWSAFASGPQVCRSAADATREGDPPRLGPGNCLPQSHRSPSKQRPESPPRASTIACDDDDTARSSDWRSAIRSLADRNDRCPAALGVALRE